jgi:hypothetical protein
MSNLLPKYEISLETKSKTSLIQNEDDLMETYIPIRNLKSGLFVQAILSDMNEPTHSLTQYNIIRKCLLPTCRMYVTCLRVEQNGHTWYVHNKQVAGDYLKSNNPTLKLGLSVIEINPKEKSVKEVHIGDGVQAGDMETQ